MHGRNINFRHISLRAQFETPCGKGVGWLFKTVVKNRGTGAKAGTSEELAPDLEPWRQTDALRSAVLWKSPWCSRLGPAIRTLVSCTYPPKVRAMRCSVWGLWPTQPLGDRSSGAGGQREVLGGVNAAIIMPQLLMCACAGPSTASTTPLLDATLSREHPTDSGWKGFRGGPGKQQTRDIASGSDSDCIVVEDDAVPKRGKSILARESMLARGGRCDITGLVGAAQHNGSRCTLTQFHETSGRWEVALDGGSSLRVKPANLIDICNTIEGLV